MEPQNNYPQQYDQPQQNQQAYNQYDQQAYNQQQYQQTYNQYDQQQNQQAYNQYDQQQYQQAHNQQQYQQTYNQQYSQQYNQPYQYGPARQLNTHRGLLKFILLGIITFGIYPLVFFSGISDDINLVASRFDGKKTMHFCLLFFLVGPITLGIADIVWFHKISSRLGNELTRRGIPYSFGAVDYWLWNVLGSLILVGPLVYIHKIAKASVLIAQDYNARG